MKGLRIILASALLAFAATQAAADGVYFKAPVDANGTGCPAGSITATGVNTDTLTVMFSKYDAAQGKISASGMARTSCNFAVPVHVPQGFQVSVMTIDWRGYAEGLTTLTREYFFAGEQGPRRTTNPSGDYTEHDGLMGQTLAYGPCGKDVQLRINSSVSAGSNPSYIVVDTIDLQNKIVFHLQWRACQ